LFKFEKQYFEKCGLKTTFIGHPVSQINSNFTETNKQKKLISFLFGSRENEIIKLYPYFNIIHDYLIENNLNQYELFIPTLPHLKKIIQKITNNWKVKLIISDDFNENENIYKKVFVSVTCSGTASLEISKRMIPQIVIYKLNLITFFIFSFFVKIKFANILNILNNKMIITEVVNNNLNKKNLLFAFNKLISDNSFRDNQIKNVKESILR
jgi:Lipid A disaccharide synthetase